MDKTIDTSIRHPECQALARYLTKAPVDEWLYAITGYDWGDGDDDFALWAIRHRRCDKAVALAAYWRSSPRYFAQYVRESDCPDYSRSIFRLLAEIERRYVGGKYDKRAELAFDPGARRLGGGSTVDMTSCHDDVIRRRKLPPEMFVPLAGRVVDPDGPLFTNWAFGMPPSVYPFDELHGRRE
jgi:hypothetical protein